jgi:hypothetical protein
LAAPPEPQFCARTRRKASQALMSGRPKRVDVVYFDAASGHVSAAAAIVRAVAQERPAWTVQAVNLGAILAGHRLMQLLTFVSIVYINDMIRHERVRNLKELMRTAIALCERLSPRDFHRIGRFWGGAPPDALVSVTPMYNKILFHSFRHANPRAPYIVIPVDIEEPTPGYWFTSGIDAQYLVGSEALLEQGRAAGLSERSLRTISGMVVDPAFYAPWVTDRAERLRTMGLDPSLPVGLVSFGGQGSIILRRIARALAGGRRGSNAIFLCGAHGEVATRLRQLELPYPHVVLDYLQDTPVEYYRLADFTIGKPGTMTIYESLVSGAPVLAIKSTGMASLQRGNERWLERSGAGLVVQRPNDLPRAVDYVLGHLPEFTAAAERHAGRGVFEAAGAICGLLDGGGHGEG